VNLRPANRRISPQSKPFRFDGRRSAQPAARRPDRTPPRRCRSMMQLPGSTGRCRMFEIAPHDVGRPPYQRRAAGRHRGAPIRSPVPPPQAEHFLDRGRQSPPLMRPAALRTIIVAPAGASRSRCTAGSFRTFAPPRQHVETMPTRMMCKARIRNAPPLAALTAVSALFASTPPNVMSLDGGDFFHLALDHRL